MITVSKFDTLGRVEIDWLSARHHFSFGHYHDPSRMGHGALRVWNDDTIQPGTGFDPHPHRDMEIVTYVRKGAITHKDRLGNEGRTEAGDVQVMHAGTGIVHAEYNLEDEATQIFQIWIVPDAKGHAPGWATAAFPKQPTGAFTVLASGKADAAGDALPIHQDAAVLGARVPAGESVTYRLGKGRKAYLVANEGSITVNGTEAEARDGVAVEAEEEIVVTARTDAEVVMVDVP